MLANLLRCRTCRYRTRAEHVCTLGAVDKTPLCPRQRPPLRVRLPRPLSLPVSPPKVIPQ